ncbi:MAG TPA: polysaccharide biosynthesis C-terminal domain-containing protein, partial [Chloroflexota bacterium]|nr:polysaccharide biosynthesis C-terminal domain-containing protein [Chloroflexota bacterium]
EAPSLLRILSLAVLPMFLNNSIPYSMIARRKQMIYVPINFAALVFNIGGNLLLIPHFGARASAGLTGLTELLVLALSLTAMRCAFGFLPPLQPLIAVFFSLLAACAVYLAASNLSYILGAVSSLATFAGVIIALRLVEPRAAWDFGAFAVRRIGGLRLGRPLSATASHSETGPPAV